MVEDLVEMDTPEWKSCKARRVSWCSEEARRLGKAFFDGLPEVAIQVLSAGSFKGGRLIRGDFGDDPHRKDVEDKPAGCCHNTASALLDGICM